MISPSPHLPVLLSDVIRLLNIQPNDIVVDGTLGFGGHSQAILAALGPNGHLIGIDQDHEALSFCKQKFANNNHFQAIHGRFGNMASLLPSLGYPKATKILVDLGVSSWQIDTPERGFSFLTDGPLDMRMNTQNPRTAAAILNHDSATQLTQMFLDYGELKNTKKFIQNLIEHRATTPFSTTLQVVSLIKKSFYFNQSRLAFLKTCAQVFQALRITVNNELEELTQLLEDLPKTLSPEGRIAIISFHSLEDRIVKQFFKNNPLFTALTLKPITATQEEFKRNSRSKSAKLRVYQFSAPAKPSSPAPLAPKGLSKYALKQLKKSEK